MKKILTIIAIIAVLTGVAVLALGIAFRSVNENFRGQMAALTLAPVDLKKIPDGVYTGRQTVFPIGVEVRVTVKKRRIAGIELVKHQNGRGEGANVIPARVVEKQTLDVDAVSGATYSSHVILKAINNALAGAAR